MNKENKKKIYQILYVLLPLLVLGGIYCGILHLIGGTAAVFWWVVTLMVLIILDYVIESHPDLFTIVLLIIAFSLTPFCFSPSNSNSQSRTNATEHHSYHHEIGTVNTTKSHPQWVYFERLSRLGDKYKDISWDCGAFSDEYVMWGGIFLKANNEIYYAFPKHLKSEILDSDCCTGMAGTVKDFFGCEDIVTVKNFENNLGLTSDGEYDGNLTYNKTYSGRYYYVTILSTDIKKIQIMLHLILG